MRTILIAILFIPNILCSQTNELYKLLNWNTPKQQKSLIAWYDLQDVSTIKLNPGKYGRVYGINDKSIWKNHISQHEYNYQPIFTKDEGFSNGKKNGISFANGGYMVYKFPSEKSVNSITSFVVCKNEIGGSKLLFDLSKEGGEGIASCYSGLYKIDSRVPNSSAQFEPDFSNNPSTNFIVSTKGSSGKINSYLNDSFYSGPGSTNFQGTSYNRIRLSTPNGDAPTNGTLYELILFDYELSDEDFMIVKNYLQKKYNSISSSRNQTVNKIEANSSSRSELIEGRAAENNSNSNESIGYVRLGDIDVQTSDLGEMNYYQAKSAIENLGQGWRLPTESELTLMFQNQDKIGQLSKRPREVVQNYYQYNGQYLGGTFGSNYTTLNTFINPGLIYNWTWREYRKNMDFFYVRAVRDMSSAEKTVKMVKAYNQLLKIAKDNGITIDNKPGFGGSSGNVKSNSSSSKPNSSNTSSKHTYQVTITWNNPNCGSCAFPRPSAQNGIVDYFYERSGSYQVKPKCPICGKTQYNTIDGFTDNIGTSNQGSKVVTINCN